MPASFWAFMAVQCAEGGAIIGGDDRINLVLLRGQDVLHDLVGVGRIPVVHPLIGDNLDHTLVHVGLEDFILALAEEDGVVVGGGAAELDQLDGVVLGPLAAIDVEGLEHAHGLLAADLDVVEGDVSRRCWAILIRRS